MCETRYVRPKIERARLRNPERAAANQTAAEGRVVEIFRQRRRQERRTFHLVYYQYDAPFLYDNFRVELGRPWENATNRAHPDVPEEQWGILTPELRAGYVGAEINPDGVELDVPPYGAITFVEDDPIVEVTVIGSACVPPGYVLLYGEPVEWQYWRTGVKMRVDGLPGEHLRWDTWEKGLDESYRDAGLSCAVFRTPPCRKITIMAGSQHIVDAPDFDNMRHDAHYAVRHIYVGVQKPA
ncbi:MAG: hypothetical protein N2512_02760 [Armatimonadetes bacterium]|nr:hypothetical protein [Armatimonadota bacterium]